MRNLPILSNEPKGILLGIILYITTHLKKLDGYTIQINLSKYKDPLAKLFEHIKWSDSNADFNICIQTQLLGDLNIRSIGLVDKLYANKVHLLPWSDPDNPIVMFGISKDKKQDVKKIKSKISKYYDTNMNLDQDIKTEKEILHLYFTKTNSFGKFDSLVKYFNNLYDKSTLSDRKTNQLSSLPLALGRMPFRQDIPLALGRMPERQDIAFNSSI